MRLVDGRFVLDGQDPPWLELRRVDSVRTCSLVASPPLGIVWHADEDPWDLTRAGRLAQTCAHPVAPGQHAGSYHVLIDRPGTIWQLAPTTVGAWHAAPARLSGAQLPANGASLGVCVLNPGRLRQGLDGLWRCWPWRDAPRDRRVCQVSEAELQRAAGDRWWPYTAEQIEACRRLTRACAAAWGRCESWTHAELMPAEREDPGPLFPLAEMQALDLPAEAPTAG